MLDLRVLLASDKTTDVVRAARHVGKLRDPSYGADLEAALRRELLKPRAWTSHSALAKALGLAGWQSGLPMLHAMAAMPLAGMVHCNVGFAIANLELTATDLSAVWNAAASGNVSLLAGMCMGIYFRGLVPAPEQILRLVAVASGPCVDEGAIIPPRAYLAAAAHRWPQSADLTQLLHECRASTWGLLRDIADASLAGRPSGWRPW